MSARPTTGTLLADSRFGECAALATAGIIAARSALATHPPSSQPARDARARLAEASYWRGFALMRMGDVTAALEDFSLTAEHAGPRRGAALAGLVECHVARGEDRRAARLAPRLQAFPRDPLARWGLADLAAARGDHEAAADAYAQVGAMVDTDPHSAVLVQWRAAQALALTRLGHRAEATVLAREALQRARVNGAPYARAQALRCLAAVDPTSDRPALLRSALEVLDAIKSLRLEAQVSTDLAGVLALAPGPQARTEVPALLRRAEQIAVQLHLQPLRDRIRRLQQVIGPELSPVTAAPMLTVSERRVADLAAAGMSNRQIATQLFVTVKAVEWHLSKVYRKLGITGRARLPGALVRLPVPPSVALGRALSPVAVAAAPSVAVSSVAVGRTVPPVAQADPAAVLPVPPLAVPPVRRP